MAFAQLPQADGVPQCQDQVLKPSVESSDQMGSVAAGNVIIQLTVDAFQCIEIFAIAKSVTCSGSAMFR